MSRMADNPKGKGFGVHLDKGKVYVSITSNWDDDAIRLQTEQALEPKKWHQVTVTHSGSRMAEGLRVHVDGQQAKVNVLLDTLYRPFRNAVGVFKQPFRIATGWGPERRFRGHIDDFRVYARALKQDEISVLAMGETLNEIAHKPEQQRSEIEEFQLRSYYLENIAPQEVRDAGRQLADLLDEKDKFEQGLPSVMVMAVSPAPRPTF